MKSIITILFVLASITSYSAESFVVEGHGYDWGYTSIDAAKENAIQQAREICKSEAEVISEWTTKIVSTKEGVFHALATAEFSCLR